MIRECWTCGAVPTPQEPACIEPMPWDPAHLRLVCKACVLFRVGMADQAWVLEEDRKDRAEHLASCSFCWVNRKEPPPLGGWFALCWKRRKLKEAA